MFFSLGGRVRHFKCPVDWPLADVLARCLEGSLRTLLGFALLLCLATSPTYATGFITAPTYAAGTSPRSVAVADFNGDGISDLAVLDRGDNSGSGAGVSILLGNGDGTFQAPRSHPSGPFPSSLAVGDFNGDGLPDLAIARNANTVDILLGNGDGTFRAA